MAWTKNKLDYGWISGGATGGAAAYGYGWPSGGTSEPNVAAQWLFDEASGSIVDEVASLTCTSSAAAPTYNVIAEGGYSGISPGIDFTSAGKFYKATAASALNLAANESYTIELWGRFDTYVGGDNPYLYAFNTNSNTDARFIGAFFLGAATSLAVWESTDDDARSLKTCTVANIFDGGFHKIRIVSNRAAGIHTIYVYFDGVLQDSFDNSATMGSIFTNGTAGINNYQAIQIQDGYNTNTTKQGSKLPGAFFELRISHNATNNSGGPGGG